uniref:Early E1A protein n=1 Tax=unclassified Simian adenoviruses TaxID=413684 RepID=Q8B6X6_9ADEN|nr:early E1A 28 kDA protein [Simian mastadenovirus sp.]
MRHLALEMISELLDLGLDTIDGWLHTEFRPVPAGVSHNMSLHEMYDLDVTGQEDENEEAVDGVFSDAMLLAAEEGIEMPNLYSPGPLVGGGEMPELQPEEQDLFCYEDGFPPSDSEEGEHSQVETERKMAEAAAAGAAAAVRGEQDDFRLDCPSVPGHGCSSCDYHRKTSGCPEILCSLCYLRANSMFIYSPVSDSEPDEPDSTTADSNHGSPPTLRCTPPRDLPRPVPVKASPGKRPAVNSLHDLIEEVEQTVPLDLSLKRSRSN